MYLEMYQALTKMASEDSVLAEKVARNILRDYIDTMSGKNVNNLSGQLNATADRIRNLESVIEQYPQDQHLLDKLELKQVGLFDDLAKAEVARIKAMAGTGAAGVTAGVGTGVGIAAANKAQEPEEEKVAALRDALGLANRAGQYAKGAFNNYKGIMGGARVAEADDAIKAFQPSYNKATQTMNKAPSKVSAAVGDMAQKHMESLENVRDLARKQQLGYLLGTGAVGGAVVGSAIPTPGHKNKEAGYQDFLAEKIAEDMFEKMAKRLNYDQGPEFGPKHPQWNDYVSDAESSLRNNIAQWGLTPEQLDIALNDPNSKEGRAIISQFTANDSFSDTPDDFIKNNAIDLMGQAAYIPYEERKDYDGKIEHALFLADSKKKDIDRDQKYRLMSAVPVGIGAGLQAGYGISKLNGLPFGKAGRVGAGIIGGLGVAGVTAPAITGVTKAVQSIGADNDIQKRLRANGITQDNLDEYRSRVEDRLRKFNEKEA